MGNIFSIFFKFVPLFIFLILEFISFAYIFRSNEYYRAGFINKSNSMVGGLYSSIAYSKKYFNLNSINDSVSSFNAALLQENLMLKNKLNSISDIHHFDSVNNSKEFVFDNYKLISAKVLNNSISNVRNYIIINKGSKDGIVKEMGVMSSTGPLGIVVEVSENYSCVMSFLNKEANISTKIQRNGQISILKWQGRDIRTASLEHIPKHIKLKKGDIVTTSGYSTYFPEGIKIGVVEKQIDNQENNFATIIVKLNTDFNNLKYVYVLDNTHLNELKNMQLETDSLILNKAENEK